MARPNGVQHEHARNGFPVPGAGPSSVVVAAPGEGPGNWAGAPSAVLDGGSIYLAYRLRRPLGMGRGFAIAVARSDDGEHFETLGVLHKDDFDTVSLERPALVRLPDGRWRLYVSCALAGTLRWRIDVLDADDPAGFDPARRTTMLAGDETVAFKDPVVRWDGEQWHMWVCCHLVSDPAEADRMETRYATGPDGLHWTWHGVALAGRDGHWDARGARITSVVGDGASQGPERPLQSGVTVAYYDGRARADDNWEEQTGVALGNGLDRFVAESDSPVAGSPGAGGGVRYTNVVPLDGGGYRLYYEASRADGAHDLRTEYAPAPR